MDKIIVASRELDVAGLQRDGASPGHRGIRTVEAFYGQLNLKAHQVQRLCSAETKQQGDSS